MKRIHKIILIIAIVIAVDVIFSALGLFWLFESGRITKQVELVDSHKVTVKNSYTDTNVLIGAGDIANCGAKGARETATLLGQNQGVIFTAGDNAQRGASLDFYNQCFGESWGQYLPRIRPSLGNHDYETTGAMGYFDYFGENAGEKGKGYYSYNIGSWHIVVLNSNCEEVGGCNENSPQGRWLKADLAANPTLCSLAYWHHPYFNSGNHGADFAVKPFWNILYKAGAEIIMNGHAHDYERFAPQTPEGIRDDENGIREFVVGTGGYVYNPFNETVKNSQVRNTGAFGVLKFELLGGGYKWQFIPVPGEKFTDSGSAKCH